VLKGEAVWGGGHGGARGNCSHFERYILEHDGLPGEELACGEGWLDGGCRREDVGLERVGLAGQGVLVSCCGRGLKWGAHLSQDNECDWLDGI